MENRRSSRNYFPEPKFQFRFLRFLLLGSFVQCAATCAILYYFLRQNYQILVQYAGLEAPVQNILYHELRILISMIAATFVVYLAGVACLGVLFSHRIAGAIYALKRTIKAINDGRLDAQLSIRQDDEFQDLVENFNKMTKALRDGAGRLRDAS